MNRWDVERAVREADLTSTQTLVMYALLTYSDACGVIPEQFTPSLTRLARSTRLGRSTVCRTLDRLEVAGWIARTPPDPYLARSAGARTTYAFKIPGSPALGLPVVPERDPGSPAAGPNQYRSSTSINRSGDLEESIIDALRKRSGKTVDRAHARRVAELILDGREPGNPVAYCVGAINRDADLSRFLPSYTPPPYRAMSATGTGAP